MGWTHRFTSAPLPFSHASARPGLILSEPAEYRNMRSRVLGKQVPAVASSANIRLEKVTWFGMIALKQRQ